MHARNLRLWALWLALSAAAVSYLGHRLYGEGTDKTVFLPGQTSHGHHQIELACSACHTSAYADREAIQAACENCHADALEEAKDDHPKSKFTDPRNADRIAVVDARYCATCHVEHRPEITLEMGVTVPADYCYLCHHDIAEDRPSHSGMAFDTCASAGCHNFHDNRALYEDFLAKHLDEVDTRHGEQLIERNLGEIAEQLPDYPLDRFPIRALSLVERQGPEGLHYDAVIDAEWLASRHAAAGVSCTACHQAEGDAAIWIDKPDHSACSSCHAGEVSGFLQGKHGMRLDVDRLGRSLPPMTPALARLPMKAAAADRELGCSSCHAAHRYDTTAASVDGCLECHDDGHSLAYLDSPHHQLWLDEQAGTLPAGSGVSCASCHMPRMERDYYWGTFVHHQVQHNQSDTLRPNEKMIRPVCLGCHGLGFAIDALADEALIERNFSGRPAHHVESLDLARERAQ